MKTAYFYITPIGRIFIVQNENFITNFYFEKENPPENINIVETELLKKAGKELDEYFKGIRKIFDLPLNAEGTEFQKNVWNALMCVPYGETRSYGDIARFICKPRAARAVGMANNRNPIPIVIPCHRVIGSDGSLTGYGGGLEIKKYLLDMESKYSYK